ncbi:MAG: stage II sporulation protein R [Lachnospiraceae bacterium]|nr:stage II sporulation protein R [Lachnospiraceae bacterium]
MKGLWLPRMVFCIFLTMLTVGLQVYSVRSTQRQVAREVVRFHVLANSDSVKDQKTKLQVRDVLVAHLQNKMKKIKSKAEAEGYLQAHKKELQKLAERTLTHLREKKLVKVYLTNKKFPVKRYGDVVFPAGNYDTLQVEIGNAKGKNWWCVMYPTLCMIDEAHASVPLESKEKLKKGVKAEAYESITCEKETPVETEIHFKMVEWLLREK